MRASMQTPRTLVTKLHCAVGVLLALLTMAALSSCRMQEDVSDKKSPGSASSPPSSPKSGPRFVKGSAEEVASVVRRELASATSSPAPGPADGPQA